MRICNEPLGAGHIASDRRIDVGRPCMERVSYFRYFLVTVGLILILLALGKKIYDRKTKISS